ncbi:TDP-N-acetylfucosamine:lipid II N-acetylfucosaminyltransferase [Gracilimonas sp. BCB1]|uniref:TDP-N-acetylfucosamine:lipid II N-acetylfucosaminyltransferase n=1 Tax=Gracilimonas sp. BCB1 TaxID=3152362 RepID=UPI0032D8C184
MPQKCVHLIIDSYVRFSLQNLIGSNTGHKIFIVKEKQYYDIQKNEVSDEILWKHINEAEVIFAHFLNEHIASFINNLDEPKKIVWFCWGQDLYDLGRFRNDFLLQKTRKAYYKTGLTNLNQLKNILQKALGRFNDFLPPNRSVLKAIQKAHVIVPVVQGDYDNLKAKYPIDAEVFNVNYVNNVFFKQPEVDSTQPRKNILVGNSASFTNNHIEAIDLLSNFSLNDLSVYIPLTYGKEKYAQLIKEYAFKKLHDQAQIIENRLPLDDYMSIFSNCRSVIMNHCRQQAMGNILLAFWFETTLFLNPKADHYKDLSQKGFKILNVSDFNPELELSNQEKKQNKDLLIKWFGPNYLQSQFNKLLQKIKDIDPN